MTRPHRPFPTLGAFLACAAIASLPASGMAQVSSNLDALGPAPTAKAPAAKAPPSSHHHTAAPPKTSAPSTSSARASVSHPPAVPDHPPPPVIIPPPGVNVPLHPPAPPAPVTATRDATNSVTTLPDGLRITFAPDTAAMNQAAIDAVHAQSAHLRDNPMQRATLLGYAFGSADDLSTPRRVSLERALALRAILINDGIAPTRIYPRPIGLAADKPLPPDRCDLTLQGDAGPAPTQASAQKATTP